jgi:methylmalonyl-CoA mutase
VPDTLKLAEDFPPVPTSEWEAAIRADLAGADYQKKLVWRTPENIAVKPYYRKEDLPVLLSQPSDPRLSEPRLSEAVKESRCAGETACAANASRLLSMVGQAVWPANPAHEGFFQSFSRSGWQMAEPGSEPSDAIRADKFHNSGATAVQELAFALAAGVDLLAADSAEITFIYGVGSNYFFEIAKLRAARLLWAQATKAFGKTVPLHLWAKTATANKSLYDRYTNLLRVTTESLSAVLGGCDALIIEPFEFPARLAANVHLLLKHEAHLDSQADPAAGSYYIEWLTDALTKEAWKLFQQVEEQGGFANAQVFIENAIATSRKAAESAVASRRRTLVGVNNYPDLQETTVSPDAAVCFDWRLAEPLERIRMRTERHAHAAGHTPTVLLLTRGDLKMRIARANFCANFFGCAGFAIKESVQLEPADLIVLCSSDPEYLALAQEIVPQVRVPVIVAGNPKDQIQALTEAGVQGFVHVFSNIVDTLTEVQSKIGVAA